MTLEELEAEYQGLVATLVAAGLTQNEARVAASGVMISRHPGSAWAPCWARNPPECQA